MDLECLGGHGQEQFWGRTTVRHVVEGEGAYASCIISIQPLGVDRARLPPSPALVACPIVGKNKRSLATAWREDYEQGGRAAARVAGALRSVKQEEEEAVREGDDEREWDEEGTVVEDANSSSSSSSSSSSGGGVRDLGKYDGPLNCRQQKRTCNSLAGSRRSSFTIDWNCKGRASFQQQHQQYQQYQQYQQHQQHQQYQQAPGTDCGGETSDEEVVDEEQMAWDHLEGQLQQLQQHPQRSQSIGDFQSTLLSLAALPAQAPILTGSMDAYALKQHAMALNVEDVEEFDECKDEGGAGDFDDLMQYGFDWGLITPSPLMR
eukprot:evm.model.NODE_10672_length_49929_cov_32.751286.8